MKSKLIVSILALLATLALNAQQPRRVTIGGNPDEMKGWPQPELRAGLSEKEIVASIERYAQTLHDSGRFSGVVLVGKDGKSLRSRAFGLADAEGKVPNDVDTKFNIGSINKIFTKTAIAQLAASGKLSLDDTIRKHLPDYPSPLADRITIAQLLEHRSGLGDIFGAKYDAAPPARLPELKDFLPLFAGEPLEFEPGTSQRYSNAGYIVLGLIIERLSGEKYRDYVQKHLFTPARIKANGFYAVDEKISNRATGYTLRGEDGPLTQRRSNMAMLPGRPSSAGGAFMTAADLFRFFDALATGRLLSKKWTNWMVSGSYEGGGKPAMGLGGGAPGVNASVEMSDGWTVVALSNYGPPSATALGRGAMSIIRGRSEEAEQHGGPVLRRRATPSPPRVEMSAPLLVPATFAEHLMVIEARVNGKGPFRFAIDSGASGPIRVSSALARTLSLEQVGEALAGDPSGRNMQRRPVVRIDSIEIGQGRFSNVEGTIGDRARGTQLDGVIGLTLFPNLTVTFDYQKPELRVTREALSPDSEHVVPYTSERGVPEITIDVAGAPVKVDVDTGSPALLSVPSAWASRMTFDGEPRVVGMGRTASNEFEIRAAVLRGEIRVAGHAQAQPTVDIVDLFPVANLGSRFLRQYAVTFDLANRRIGLEK